MTTAPRLRMTRAGPRIRTTMAPRPRAKSTAVRSRMRRSPPRRRMPTTARTGTTTVPTRNGPRPTARASAMRSGRPVDEVREALDDSDHWQPEPAEPIGWRTASPTLVLSWAAALGAVALLLIGIIFFRPLPGWYLLIGLAVGIGGAVGLFFHLPQ